MTDNNINIPEATPVTMTQLQDLFNTFSERVTQQTADLIAASSASGGTNNGNSNFRDSHILELKELHKKILALEEKQLRAKALQEIEESEKTKQFQLATLKAKVVQIMKSLLFVRSNIKWIEQVRDFLVNELPVDVEIPDKIVDAVNKLFDHNSQFVDEQELAQFTLTTEDSLFRPADLASDKRLFISALSKSLWNKHKGDWKNKKVEVYAKITKAVDLASKELHEERSCRAISKRPESSNNSSNTSADKGGNGRVRKRGSKGGKKKGNKQRKIDDTAGLSVTFDADPSASASE